MYFTYYFSLLLRLELILPVSDFFIPFINYLFLSKSHTTLRAALNPISHCSPLFNMAAASGSTWNDSQKDEIIRIAESAIETITQLSNVVGRSNPALVPAPSSSSSSRSENAVDELHRRFPTAGSRTSRGSRSIRPAPYLSRRPAGRPRESLTVSKDVIVIEYEHDRVPSKAEKIELEKSKRVISGFEVNREWSAKELERELAALLRGTPMQGFCFKIMKNCSGTLVAPNIPSGRRIDSKLLLKSIAPSGCIYIRLLAELPDESDDMHNFLNFQHAR